MDDDVEERNGQQGADEGSPGPLLPSQDEGDDDGDGDPHRDLGGEQEVDKRGVEGADQAHGGRGPRKQDNLGTERRLAQALCQRLVEPGGDQQSSVRCPVHPPHVVHQRTHDDHQDRQPGQICAVSDVEREVDRADTDATTREVPFAIGQEEDDGGEGKCGPQNAVDIEVGYDPPHDDAGGTGDRRCAEEGEKEREVVSDGEHTEGVEA